VVNKNGRLVDGTRLINVVMAKVLEVCADYAAVISSPCK